jgi:hypothetical protein
MPRVLLLVVSILLLPVAVWAHPLEIHVLNVGQGDATLVIGPEKTLLIDAGEEMAGGKTHYKEIAAAIKQLTKRSSIDYFVISHYHFDHMETLAKGHGNGLFGLIDEAKLRIGTLIDRGDDIEFGEGTGPHDALQQAIKRWTKNKTVGKRERARLGTDQIKLGGGVVVEIVAVNGNGRLEKINQERPDYFKECPPSENDYSVALKITFGDFEYFTGGDLAGEDTKRSFHGTCTSYNDVETVIAMKVGNIEVMKINHHGSAFSSSGTFPCVTLVAMRAWRMIVSE